MPKNDNNASEQLKELEKLVKKILRKSLKDNTLDYSVSLAVSNQDPGTVKYAVMISSPAKGVTPITYITKKFDEMKALLEQSVENLDRTSIERAFHEYEIGRIERRKLAHEAAIVQIDNPVEEDEEIELEEV